MLDTVKHLSLQKPASGILFIIDVGDSSNKDNVHQFEGWIKGLFPIVYVVQ